MRRGGRGEELGHTENAETNKEEAEEEQKKEDILNELLMIEGKG